MKLIAHVVRCFENADVVHVAGRISALADVEVINTELALADLSTVEKALDRASKSAKSGDKEALKRRELIEQLRALLDQGMPARTARLSAAQWRGATGFHLADRQARDVRGQCGPRAEPRG